MVDHVVEKEPEEMKIGDKQEIIREGDIGGWAWLINWVCSATSSVLCINNKKRKSLKKNNGGLSITSI